MDKREKESKIMKYEHLCPVCQNHTFNNLYDNCPICNWCNEEMQEDFPDENRMANIMSLNEAKQAYREGKEIY